MIPTQEITLQSKNGALIESLIEQTGTTFNASIQVLKYDSSKTNPDPFFQPFIKSKNSAKDAFKELFEKLNNELKSKNNDFITNVNNPCNDELVSIEDQQTIVGEDVIISLNQ